jgi:predicted NACHT family NTPase
LDEDKCITWAELYETHLTEFIKILESLITEGAEFMDNDARNLFNEDEHIMPIQNISRIFKDLKPILKEFKDLQNDCSAHKKSVR